VIFVTLLPGWIAWPQHYVAIALAPRDADNRALSSVISAAESRAFRRAVCRENPIHRNRRVI
jgi:hypothetical protein